MLIDPPDYVAIPPALIYGAEDLERELYRALLQITGWLWVTKRHQKPLITTVGELADRWQIAERTVYDRLQRLADRGYLQVSYANTRVYIRPGAQHTHTHTPGEPAHIPGEPETHTPGEPAHTHTDQKPDFAVVQTACTARANSLHETAATLTSNSSSCRSDQNYELDPDQQQLQLLLVSAGVFGDIAARLAADPWTTAERINAWTAALARDKGVRNLGACLNSNLTAHREPPPDPDDDRQARRRFISGKYAHLIEH
jgi:hypothetical protein